MHNRGLKETPEERSVHALEVPRSLRTEWNVRDADGTLVIKPTKYQLDAGTNWTIEAANSYNKPLLFVDPANKFSKELILHWIGNNTISIMNIAGPSENSSKGISKKTFELLRHLLESQT